LPSAVEEGKIVPEPTTLATFVVAAVALLLAPGPAVMFVVARSVEQGRRAGMASVVGGSLGNLVHVCAATLGLSAILASSALAFSVVKYAGAAYLVYLGVRVLLSKEADVAVVVSPQPLRRVFSQAFVVYALNPKTALFFLAFLPQFANAARGAVAPQLLLLGVLFVLLALVTDSGYAMLAGSLAAWLRRNARLRRGHRYFAGGVYLALAAVTALGGEQRK
jgi:threonine/homoserine/homoserine lactone efflux protein